MGSRDIFMLTLVTALDGFLPPCHRKEGGVLHVHGNAKDTEESEWSEHIIRSFDQIARSEGYCWEVSLEHVQRVKWYAPHVRHLVADVRCKHIQH
uniref:tRNA wybutosine-synthesizing protein 2/3/4 n=1 Tax=Rhizophora mucronata TaxID=61149 RepID=A0A2P2KSD6_RHIMU